MLVILLFDNLLLLHLGIVEVEGMMMLWLDFLAEYVMSTVQYMLVTFCLIITAFALSGEEGLRLCAFHSVDLRFGFSKLNLPPEI